MIDRELVTRKAVLIAGDLKALEPIAAKRAEDYLSSTKTSIPSRCASR